MPPSRNIPRYLTTNLKENSRKIVSDVFASSLPESAYPAKYKSEKMNEVIEDLNLRLEVVDRDRVSKEWLLQQSEAWRRKNKLLLVKDFNSTTHDRTGGRSKRKGKKQEKLTLPMKKETLKVKKKNLEEKRNVKLKEEAAAKEIIEDEGREVLKKIKDAVSLTTEEALRLKFIGGKEQCEAVSKTFEAVTRLTRQALQSASASKTMAVAAIEGQDLLEELFNIGPTLPYAQDYVKVSFLRL